MSAVPFGQALMSRDAAYWRCADGVQITAFAYKPPPNELSGCMVQVHRALEADRILELQPNPVGSSPGLSDERRRETFYLYPATSPLPT